MSENDSKTLVGVLMDPDQLQDLEDIQAFHGIKNRSDVIRMLVRAEVRRLNADAPLFAGGGRRD